MAEAAPWGFVGGASLLVAVFLSNVPESLAAATGFKAAGWSAARRLALWAGVAVVFALAFLLSTVE